jgi:hypothetical protein
MGPLQLKGRWQALLCIGKSVNPVAAPTEAGADPTSLNISPAGTSYLQKNLPLVLANMHNARPISLQPD